MSSSSADNLATRHQVSPLTYTAVSSIAPSTLGARQTGSRPRSLRCSCRDDHGLTFGAVAGGWPASGAPGPIAARATADAGSPRTVLFCVQSMAAEAVIAVLSA